MKPIRITENDLKQIIKEAVTTYIKEASNSNIKKKVINQIYKYVQPLTSHLYTDNDWRGVSNTFKTIESVIGDNGELEVNVENGGYWKHIQEFPNYKEYKFTITLNNGIVIGGSLKCHSAGTMEDPFGRYDITITMC